jgi:hypothetical protein
MKQTLKHPVMVFLALAVPLGLVSLLVAARPAVAEPTAVIPLPPVAETDGQAGVCYSFYHEGSERPYLPMAYDAGSRWDRFDFSWPTIEPANDTWNFGPHDSLVNDLHATEIDMVGILLWTPDWAATQGLAGLGVPSLDERPFGWYAPIPRDPSLAPRAVSAACSPPQGLYLPRKDPNNHWANYVYTVVSRYGDRVKHWEIWNEAEWDVFWCGSDADYARLLKIGYRSVKAACPDCTVLFAGLHYWADPGFFERVLDVLDDDPGAPANSYFFDVMSVHFYSRSSNAYDMVNHVRNRMKLYVPDHPIWLTETGVPVWNDSSVDPDPTKYDFAARRGEAAAYVIQSYANAWASNAGRYLFFRTHDADMGEYFGLIRNDHSLRPSYVAYQVAATYLISPTFVSRVPQGSNVRVTLWGTPHGKVSVLWNGSPTAAGYTLSAVLSKATLVDRRGNTSTIVATGGSYHLTLPGATANLVDDPDDPDDSDDPNDYIIGGDPLIVVEAETPNEPPTSTVNPLPTLVHTTTFKVTWQGQDNESGVWLYDVQVRDGESGEWVGWLHSTAATSAQFAGQDYHTYYFRSRAMDRLGNRGPWPEQSQAQTTVDLPRPLHLSVENFFADENHNGVWDKPISATNEITLTGVTLQLLDEAGRRVGGPTTTGAFTATVCAEQTYHLWASSADHLSALPLSWPRGGVVYTETIPVLGLWPVTRFYLPLAGRDE